MKFKTRLQVLGSLLGLQGSFSNQYRQGAGVLLVVGNAKEDADAGTEFVDRHLELFNTHPAMAGPILGAVSGKELEAVSAQTPAEQKACLKRGSKLKLALAPPFAAVGDGLFWRDLRGGLGLLAAALSLAFENLWVIVGYVLAYNLIHLGLRLGGFFWGFGNPERVSKLLQVPSLKRLTRWSVHFVWIGVAAMSMTLLSSTSGFKLLPVGIAFCLGVFWGHKGWIPIILAFNVGRFATSFFN